MGTEKKPSKKKISTKKVDINLTKHNDERLPTSLPSERKIVSGLVKNTPVKNSKKKLAAPEIEAVPVSIEILVGEHGKFKKTQIKVIKVSVPPLKKKSLIKRLSFQLKYHTTQGENIFVVGNHKIVGKNSIEHAFPLQYLNEDYWVGTIDIDAAEIINSFVYSYFVKDAHGSISSELESDKKFDISLYNAEEVRLIDTWSFAGQVENTFFTEPFQNVLLKNNFTPTYSPPKNKYTHIFRVKAPLLHKNQVLGIYGSSSVLHNWDTSNPILLSRKEDENWWTVQLDLSDEIYPITYKYGIYDIATSQFVQMEGDKNRILYGGVVPINYQWSQMVLQYFLTILLKVPALPYLYLVYDPAKVLE